MLLPVGYTHARTAFFVYVMCMVSLPCGTWLSSLVYLSFRGWEVSSLWALRNSGWTWGFPECISCFSGVTCTVTRCSSHCIGFPCDTIAPVCVPTVLLDCSCVPHQPLVISAFENNYFLSFGVLARKKVWACAPQDPLPLTRVL